MVIKRVMIMMMKQPTEEKLLKTVIQVGRNRLQLLNHVFILYIPARLIFYKIFLKHMN